METFDALNPCPTELWTWREISAHTHRCRTAAFDLVRSAGFPTPVYLNGSQSDRLWVADEVRAFVAASRSAGRKALLTPILTPVTSDEQPLVVALRPRRRSTALPKAA